MRIVLATSNKGKIKELKSGIAAFAPHLECVSMDELIHLYGEPPEVEESQHTYIGNATLKADAIFSWAKKEQIVLSDDAGIEVHALGGRPGVFTARYRSPTNPELSPPEAVEEALRGVCDRTCKMISVIVTNFPDGRVLTARGEMSGKLAHQRSACVEGFGFDPWFIPEGETATVADVKHQQGATFMTHRLKALRDILAQMA